MKLQHTQRFLSDLKMECAYLRERNPVAARELRDRVLGACERLRTFPDSGRAWRLSGARELVIPGVPYIVIYRVRDEGVVQTLKLFHSARDVAHVH